MKLKIPVITTKSSLESLLVTLAHVSPPECLVHVGAGEGSGPTHTWHSWGISNVLLLDSDPVRLAWSKQLREMGTSVVTCGQVVSDASKEMTFYNCSLATEDGLVDPKDLRSLWSNLAEVARDNRLVLTLDQVVAQQWDGLVIDTAWLVIDCFGGGAILNGAAELLNKTDVVCARVLVDENVAGALENSTFISINQKLIDSGFGCAAVVTGWHPKIAYAVFCRNVVGLLRQADVELKAAQTGWEASKGEVSKLKSTLEAKESECVKFSQTAANAAKELSQKAQHVSSLQTAQVDLEQQIKQLSDAAQEKAAALKAAQTGWEASKGEVSKLKSTLEAKESELASIRLEVAQAHKNNADVTQLEKKLEALFSEQRHYIQQTTNALGQHVTRTSQQQRDHSALLQYMQSGLWPTDTKMSPGYGKSLIELRDTRQYDVIVVFGSLTTAQFLAQVVMSPRADVRKLSSNHDSVKDISDLTTSVSQRDLPQSIVMFEHQKDQCDALKKKLQTRGYAHAVEVVNAPWIESSFQGESMLFYSCERTLQRLNQWLKEDARVLVVVGDAMFKAEQSRLAALPTILQHLPTQAIDFLLENPDINSERDLSERWESLVQARQLSHEKLNVPTAWAMRINA